MVNKEGTLKCVGSKGTPYLSPSWEDLDLEGDYVM